MDVDLIFKIAAIGILVAVLNLLLVRSGREEQAMMTTLAGLIVVLKRTGPDMGLLLALAVCGAGLALLLEPLGVLRDFLEEAAGWGDLPLQLFTPLVKTVGIALVSRTGSDLCRDAGESAVASVLETAGAAAAIWVSLPLFQAAWELLRSLL